MTLPLANNSENAIVASPPAPIYQGYIGGIGSQGNCISDTHCPSGSLCESGRCVCTSVTCRGGCTSDSQCSPPLPGCDTTINRCVECPLDSHCSGSRNYCNRCNECEQCVWDTTYQCNLQQTKRIRYCRLADGTIKQAQELSCASNKVCKNAQCVAAANCPAGTATWTESTYSCTAPLTAKNHNTTVTLTDSTGTDPGTATYKCWDGTWIKQKGGCGPSCPAGTKHWTVGSNACSAAIATGIAGSTTTANDTTLNPNRGTATYLCSSGRWVEQPGSTCAPCVSCAAGCTAWSPSNACSGSTFTQTRTCINTCGSYNCATNRTSTGTQYCAPECTSHWDCESKYGSSSWACSNNTCKPCTWDPIPDCGTQHCSGDGISYRSHYHQCAIDEFCEHGYICTSCNCTSTDCLVGNRSAGCYEEGVRYYTCSNPNCESSFSINCWGDC